MTELTRVVEDDHRVGEGPLWHPEEAVLYHVEIKSGQLFRYDPTSGTDERVLELVRPLGGYTIEENGDLLLFLGGGAIATWDGDELTTVVDGIPRERASRFNDVIADPDGRVYAGTMPTDDQLGRLYRIEPDGSYEFADDRGFDIPNGMGFTPDLDGIYVTESQERTIYRYDYDRATGELSNRRAVVELDPDGPEPDGMTVDEDGYIWSGLWNGHAVVRFAPDGTEVERIEIPAPKASSVTFGGRQYRDLYITTAKGHDAEDDPPAGSVFRARPGVVGVPEFRSRIGD